MDIITTNETDKAFRFKTKDGWLEVLKTECSSMNQAYDILAEKEVEEESTPVPAPKKQKEQKKAKKEEPKVVEEEKEE